VRSIEGNGERVSFSEDFITIYNSRDLERFLALFAPEARYTDMAVKMTFEGIDEIRMMYQYVCVGYGEFEFTCLGGVSDDHGYSIEWSMRGTASDGREHTTRAMSGGELDDQGRIVAHRDYWNPTHFPEAGTVPVSLRTNAEAWLEILARSDPPPTDMDALRATHAAWLDALRLSEPTSADRDHLRANYEAWAHPAEHSA
jgi:ketosteroid isomerase-like protein